MTSQSRICTEIWCQNDVIYNLQLWGHKPSVKTDRDAGESIKYWCQASVKCSIVTFQGPETSFGASNFIPSWMFWQKLPRQLQYPKTVILHRRDGTSWGFSIVGNIHNQTQFSRRIFFGTVKPNWIFSHVLCLLRLLVKPTQTNGGSKFSG